MKILSIQSSVAYGHAGNSSAVFPLQRLGHEVWPVYTVHFSNHTGYGQWRGPVFDAETVREVITGIEERGVLPECDAVLSGYQGGEGIGEVILDAVARVKAANPRAIYCADPVMGDVGRGFYVRDGIPEFMRDKVIPAADIVTPNQFELEFLSGIEVHSVDDLLAAADTLRATGPSTVLATSVQTDQTPADSVQMAVVNDEGAWIVTTPLLPMYVAGAGDATAAIFLAHVLNGKSAPDCLAATADSVFGIMEATHRAGTREIQLVTSQERIAHPEGRFEVTRLR
ncbi:pyridoxal kinase PdxY [Calidifontibacter sp. DB0510]|uniref:pyridoxal kinase n=1 Tax=Metallococcus carri TaxID=1656884 RepID=A0A967EAH7_9MICO|nr:pyridoxal kinase PdxY [Metallococcus carri]NHN56280.1 pyridoxal kinase PdxY [Metallococcus carri]NOP38668.1 pyridoxal kinase PdxY [Calidifontibacter sp. DB2511S]